MKKIIILTITVLSLVALVTFAQDSDSAKNSKNKTYTQKEFDKAVKEEVSRQIGLVKKKSVAQLTRELLEQESIYKNKVKDLDLREEQLKKGEMRLVKSIEAFETRQKKLIGCMDKNKEGEQLRIKQLVNMISNMKPAKAAALLSVQETDISVKIIAKIDPTKASKIFNLMDKDISAKLQKKYLKMEQ